jgi:hypothetical protein
MAQKFTVDPRLLAAVTSGTYEVSKEQDQEEEEDSDADDSSVEEEEETPEEIKKRQRKEKLERLAAEYEEECLKAKAAAESGDGCLMCGS